MLCLKERKMPMAGGMKDLVELLNQRFGDEICYEMDSSKDNVLTVRRTPEPSNIVVGVTFLKGRKAGDEKYKLWNGKEYMAAKIGPFRKQYMVGQPGNPPDFKYEKGYCVKTKEQCVAEVEAWLDFFQE